MITQEYRDFLKGCTEMDLIEINEVAKDNQDFETRQAVADERYRRSKHSAQRTRLVAVKGGGN